MPDNRISENDAFDLLNSEFSNFALEKENARNLEALRRRNGQQQPQKAPAVVDEEDIDEDDEDDSGGRGCVGTFFRILIILLLAGAVAWIIFMPQGSLGELWDKFSPNLSAAYSWAAGLLGGEKNDAPSQSSDKDDSQDDSDNAGATTAASSESTAQTTAAAVSSEDGDAVESTDTDNSSYSITVYRPSQIVIVYDSAGNPVKVFSCSSGKAATPTKLGDYAIRAKYRWRFMVGNCYTQYASSFSSGYLFHSIPYNKKNAGTMSNASYDKLGNPASSGCIRLCFRDTKWIYDNCPIGTKVRVVDENAPAGSVPEIIPERIKDSAHNGWDPTDDSPDSPYNQ